MSLHPVLEEKLNSTLAAEATAPLTRRETTLPKLPNKVHAVTGMRRSGKTTFLHQLVAERRQAGPANRAIYISFDDDRLADIQVDQLSALLEAFYRRFPELRQRETVSWFFDEIQLVQGWERFVRRLLDTERVEVVVSGSSARMLSREVHTSLRGRGIETVIRPFSFREFLRHRGDEPSSGPRRWTAAQRSHIEKHFTAYLLAGGFPEAQGLTRGLRVELLQGYVDTVLLRDIMERYGVSQVSALRWVARHCLRNPAGSISAHRLHQDLKAQGYAVGKDSVHALLAHLVDSFLVSTVSLHSASERQRNSNPRKLYPADPALIHAFDTTGRTNLGHALETAVFNELQRRCASVDYCKTPDGYEVDFHVLQRNGDQDLIQVCAETGSGATREREQRALRSALAENPKASARILVLTQEQSTAMKGSG
ncbi:MAG TPA: ATP-binding protein, partial [Polyangiaceae bacterium]